MLFNADHGAVGSHHRGHFKRDIAQPSAQVEDAHAGPNAATLQEQRCWFGEHCCLTLKPDDFRVVASENVIRCGHTATNA